MIKTSLIFGVALLLIIASCNSLIISGQRGYEYIFVFYIPHGSVGILLNTTQGRINASTLYLERDLLATPDYYLYRLLTGRRATDLNISILDTNVNQNWIEQAWRNASLVDIPIVDPTVFSFAINPLYNVSYIYLKPEIITLPINNTGYSSSLNTSIKTSLIDYSLELKLEMYNLTLTIENIRSVKTVEPKKISIQEPDELIGDYYVTFYVLDYNETHVKLLYPGSLKTTGYFSEGIRQIDAVTTHWYLLIKYEDLVSDLEQDAVEWWVNRTIDTSFQFIRQVIYYSNNVVNIIYTPQISIAKKLLNGESIERVQSYLYDRIIFALQAFASVEKPYYLALFTLIGDENTVVFASRSMDLQGAIEINITISEFVASLLALSDLTPVAFRADPDLRAQVEELKSQVNQLSTNISQLNNRLSETMNKLVNCETARELAETRLLYIDSLRREAEDLLNTARQYLLTAVAIPVAISVLMGFLALKISSKKPSK
ncbi:MAG: hypothetical protein QXE81_03400 [Desulfurococcaceae archaeon]